ncbi:enoyl reductase [Moelleriella libera RCEF 2490]|uniref:Enoyl reductase n=1 Tax=Moelleriella libera RCEF 2490 TaxID=1081109 RepID=A0A168EL47_9HYPO|nr:enoyl reductase [Moelleriella libera RCEF 2490]
MTVKTLPSIPKTQKAIVATDAEGTLRLADDVPVIELEPDSVIVKTAALALNPVDSKMMKGFAEPNHILGFDFAGTVVAVGSGARKDVKVGDRVLGSGDSMFRGRPSGGAFAEYASTIASLTVKLPDDMSFEEGACMGTSMTSAGMALFNCLKIPLPDPHNPTKPSEKAPFVLVSGGSTSTGTMAIQMLRWCNYRVIVTCSPQHNDLVLSYGAEKAFDYRSPTAAQDIRAYTKNSLLYAFDCITTASTMKLCYEAIGRAGGRYAALDPYPESGHTRRIVKPGWILASLVKGRGSSWAAPYGREPDAEALEFGENLLALAQQKINAGQMKSHPARVSSGGFAGVLEGIEMIRRKEVSGFKLVYTV